MIDVEGVLERLQIEYTISRNEAVALCPQHLVRTGKADHNPSWSVNLDTGLHFCFACSYRGTLDGLVKDLLGCDEWEAAKFIGSDEVPLAERLARPEPERLVIGRIRVDRAQYLSFDVVSEEMASSRSLSPESCDEYGLRSRDGAWVIPIHAQDGSFLGWQEKKGPRVRNRPMGVKKGECLFGFNKVSQGTVVVVESPLDAVLAYERTGHRAVALYGARATKQQMRMISEFDDPVIALDNDDAGRLGTRELSSQLSALGVRHRIVAWESGKDFGDCPEQVSRLVSQAEDPLVRQFRRAVL